MGLPIQIINPVTYSNLDRLLLSTLRGGTQFMAEMTTVSDLHFNPESLATYNQTEESATRNKGVTRAGGSRFQAQNHHFTFAINTIFRQVLKMKSK